MNLESQSIMCGIFWKRLLPRITATHLTPLIVWFTSIVDELIVGISAFGTRWDVRLQLLAKVILEWVQRLLQDVHVGRRFQPRACRERELGVTYQVKARIQGLLCSTSDRRLKLWVSPRVLDVTFPTYFKISWFSVHPNPPIMVWRQDCQIIISEK